MRSQNLRGHFQFHGGCDATDAPLPGNGLPANRERDVGAVVVVCPEPLRGVILCLLDTFDDVLVKPFMPDGAVVALPSRRCGVSSAGRRT